MDITELLPITQEFSSIYEDRIEKGKNFLINQKVCIVGLTRNSSAVINKNLKSLLRLGEYMNDYRIVLFENDSSDDTVKIIENICSNNSKIQLISQQFNRPQFGSVQNLERTRALAEYRNILREHIKNHYADYDFTIVTDTDFDNFSLEGVFNSFGWISQNKDIGAVCGNTFEYKQIFSHTEDKSLWNYDCWAYRGSWWNNLQTHSSAKINYNPMLWFGVHILPVGSNPLRINSGFGGMCIYKNHFFINGNYSGEDCEHVMFHYNLKQKYPDFHLFLNPSQRMLLS